MQTSLQRVKEHETKGIEGELELSKQLEYAIENEKIVKSNNDRDFRELKEQQGKLVEFMEQSKFRQELVEFRDRNRGWPSVFELGSHLEQI